MKKHTILLTVILGISCLCGCSKLLGDFGRIDEVPEPTYEIVDYSEVKEGYYLSTNNDGSYVIIENNTLNFAGIDWYARYSEREPRREYQTESEYEELASIEIQYWYINRFVNQPFIPIRYINMPEMPEGIQLPYLELITNASEETVREHLNDGSFGYSSCWITMPNENTIVYDIYTYVYCGTSLPESVQTQTSD